MHPARLVSCFTLALGYFAFAGATFSAPLPIDHPCGELVKKYLTCVVNQEWKTAASLLQTASLERKQKETIAIIKTAPTMSEEQAMLERFGVKEIRELEKLTPQEFYIMDREAWHKRINAAADVTKRKQDTLKIEVLGLVEEKEKGYVHATVRTSQETLTDRIEELFLISFVKQGDSWTISPEMKDRPIITPLEGKDDAKK